MRVGEAIRILAEYPSYYTVVLEVDGCDVPIVDIENWRPGDGVSGQAGVQIVGESPAGDDEWQMLPNTPTPEMLAEAMNDCHMPECLATNVWHAMVRALSRD